MHTYLKKEIQKITRVFHVYYKLVLYFDAFTHQSNAGNRICIFGVNLAEPIDFNGKIKFYAPRTFFYFYFFKYASHKKTDMQKCTPYAPWWILWDTYQGHIRQLFCVTKTV